jgi:hypothetical protein
MLLSPNHNQPNKMTPIVKHMPLHEIPRVKIVETHTCMGAGEVEKTYLLALPDDAVTAETVSGIAQLEAKKQVIRQSWLWQTMDWFEHFGRMICILFLAGFFCDMLWQVLRLGIHLANWLFRF